VAGRGGGVRVGVGVGVLPNKKYVLISSIIFVRNISDSQKNSVRYYHKCTLAWR